MEKVDIEKIEGGKQSTKKRKGRRGVE